MTNILERHWRRVAWFMASFLTALLFSVTSNQIPTTAAVQPKTVLPSSFDQVAASHLEPNFYQ